MTEKLVGLAFAALGVAILILSLQLPEPLAAAHIAYGAGFFPTLLAIAITLAGLVMSLKSTAEGPQTGDEDVVEFHWVRPAIVMGAGVAYVLLAQQVGFLVLAPIILTGLLLLGRAAVFQALLIGILGPILIYFLFAKLLLVPLPLGLLTPLGAFL